MKREKITQELLEKIIVDYKNGMTPKQMSDKYIINAGTIISRLQSIGIYKNTTYRFTEADLQYLKDHYPKEDINVIMKRFPNVSKQSIHTFCSKHSIKSYYRMKNAWSEEDLKIILDNYDSKTLNELYELINGRHTIEAIRTKAGKCLGLSKDRTWTKEEIDILKEYYKIESVDAILKRLPRRTRGAVIDKAMSLGLRNYTKLLVDWTNEQTSFLINNWGKMSDKQLAIALHKKQVAVRDKRYYLGLSRFANHYNKATYENLNKFLRGNTNSWKTRSMKECNYQCILTGSKDFAIHHLYSFSSIVNEVLEENNFELKDSFSDYTEDELIFILNKFVEKQDQYPNGVCIRKDIHDLFHREYGTVVTPDMWNDFVDNYKKGKYII
jgi:hypothetical protein